MPIIFDLGSRYFCDRDQTCVGIFVCWYVGVCGIKVRLFRLRQSDWGLNVHREKYRWALGQEGGGEGEAFAGFCGAESRLVSVELMMKRDYGGRHLSPWWGNVCRVRSYHIMSHKQCHNVCRKYVRMYINVCKTCMLQIHIRKDYQQLAFMSLIIVDKNKRHYT